MHDLTRSSRPMHRLSSSGTGTAPMCACLFIRATAGPQQELIDIITALMAEASAAGVLRTDFPVDELAGFCLHALGWAAARRCGRETRA